MKPRTTLLLLVTMVALVLAWNWIAEPRLPKPESVFIQEVNFHSRGDTHREQPQSQEQRPKQLESMIARSSNQTVVPWTQNNEQREETDPINLVVFNREAFMRRFSEGLQVGMSRTDITNFLGNPHAIFKYVTNGWEFTRQVISSTEQEKTRETTYWIYSPNFDDSFEWHGIPYHQLRIEFDANFRVIRWEWEEPFIRLRMKVPRTVLAQ